MLHQQGSVACCLPVHHLQAGRQGHKAFRHSQRSNVWRKGGGGGASIHARIASCRQTDTTYELDKQSSSQHGMAQYSVAQHSLAPTLRYSRLRMSCCTTNRPI
jgi:hypothetical protein